MHINKTGSSPPRADPYDVPSGPAYSNTEAYNISLHFHRSANPPPTPQKNYLVNYASCLVVLTATNSRVMPSTGTYRTH